MNVMQHTYHFPDKDVKSGDVINFCWVANKKVNAKWIKDGKTLQDGGRISIPQPGDCKYLSLAVKDAREEDEGEYTLVLWNNKHTVSGSAKVKVLGRC